MSEEEGDEAVSEDVQIEAPNQGVEEEHQESEEEKGISHVEPKPWSGFVDLPIGQGGMLVKVSVDPSCPRWVSFIFNDDTYYFDRFLNGDFTIYESKENKDSAEEDGEEGEGAKDATQDQEELVADQDTPEPFDHRLRFVITRRDASSGDDETSYILMKENTAHEDPNTSGNDEASDRNEVDEASSKSSEEEQFRDITLDVLSIAILYSQHVAFKCIELGADLQVYTEWLQRSLTSQSYIMIERLCQVASHRKGTLSMNYDWIFHSSRLCVTQEGDDMSQTLTRSLTRLLESSISPTQHIPSTSQLLSRHEEFRLYLNVLMKVPLKNFSNWSRTSDEDASDDMANDSSMMLPSFFVECVKLLRRYVARLNNHRKQPYRVPFEEAFEALTQTVQFSGSEDELFLDRFSWCMFYPHSLSIRYSDILLILLALHSPRITYTAFTRLLTRKNTVLLSTLKRNLGKPWPSTPELLFSFAHCHHSSDFLLWAIKNWEPSKVPLHGIVDFGRFFSNLARLRTQTGDVEVAPDDRCLQHLCQWFYIETDNIKQLAQACARGTAIPSCFMKALEHLNMKMNNLSALLIQWARTSCDLEQTKIETQYTEYLNDFCDTFCHAFSHFLPRLMHVAISEQVPRAVQLLLNRGCHLTWPPLYPNACDAFPEALEKGTHEVVAMFLKAGHSLNITWNNNRCDGIECLQRRFPNKTVIDLTTIWMENQKIAQNNKDQLFGLICNRANSIKRN